MAISFSCDCGQEFKVSDSHAGKRIKCQACGNPVKIPALSGKKSKSDSGAVAAVGKTAKKKRAVDEEEDPLVHSASEYDSAYEFDIGNVPMGKLIEEEEGLPKGKSGKKSKKSGGEKAEKPKKKKKDEDAANPVLIGVFLVLGLASLSTLGYFGFRQFGGAVDNTPLEKNFVLLEGPEKVWKFERPEDWKVEQMTGGTGGKPPVVLIQGDGATFRIKGSMGGSAVGSIAQAGGGAGIAIPGQDDGPVGGGADLSPETAVHEFQQKFFKEDYKEFEEEPMQKLKIPYGEGRLSIFTAKESFLAPKIKGYRVTFSDNNWQYNLRAYAKESEWEKFQPTFKRMIDSISR